jgi:hypothetical protein
MTRAEAEKVMKFRKLVEGGGAENNDAGSLSKSKTTTQ